MASDNTTLNPGTGGDVIRTDEIGSVHFPTSKITLGNDNTNDGFVSASNPMPVNIATTPVQVSSVAVVWGVGTTSISVGTSNTAVLAANASRQGVVLVNDSANVIYLRIGSAAALNTGIRINANGGAYEMNNTNISTQVINAIATAAASNLTVLEGI